MLRVSGVALLAVVLLAGCGGPARNRPAPGIPLPDGFKRLGGLANGMILAVPESWKTVDLAKADFEKELEGSGLTGAALETARSSLHALQANKAVYALDPASQSESPKKFVTNLNGFCQPSVGGSADALIQVAKEQLGSVQAKVSSAAPFRLGNGTGVRIAYTLESGDATVNGTQYYAPSEKGTTCVVTISTDMPGKDVLFDQIGSTLRPL